jgi:tRNA(adenine34) deaminase
MRRCLELAVAARSRGDIPVGSVAVLDGEVVGEAGETLPTGRSVTGHAEVLACQEALERTGRRDLAGAVLYTTAEPCFMCSFVIRQLRLAHVFYGVATPLIGGITSGHPVLTDPALDSWRSAPLVTGGVLREECERLRSK